ncbi:MCP four helix bundle domain-containing protein [Aromatoleum petrolei]|uniref:HAMP domain-containing protein n=1 Tax=Aromatoleum petrolei TaxID=76116 RepID=A0ABX1MLH1_9RHOO|nr:MCP four helix bundle domain-containing protein [Aromatoleum petrolei]NMF87541.1 HAMP domain-containing protein [Aromatoleum petrolei]QTQ38638.1 Chemotaxis methyl-accepting receptor HlyB-like domain-containing protein [Aromatoleum petrolei]
MTIRNKLILGFSVLLAFIFVQGAATVFYGSRTQDLVDTAVNRNFIAATEITDLLASAQQLRRQEKEYLIYAGNVDGRNAVLEDWNATHARILGQLEAMVANSKGIYLPADSTAFAQWKGALDGYQKEFARIVEGFSYDVSMLDEGETAGGSRTYNKAVRANEELRPVVDRFNSVLIEGATKLARTRAEESALAYQGIRGNFDVVDYVNIGFAVAGLLLAGGLLATIPGSITRPLESLIESADKMSLGDLGKKFEAGGVRDFERLAASLERMRVTMEAMIVRLKARSR